MQYTRVKNYINKKKMKNPFVSHYIAFLDVGLYKYYVYFLNIIKPFRLIIEIRHSFTF